MNIFGVQSHLYKKDWWRLHCFVLVFQVERKTVMTGYLYYILFIYLITFIVKKLSKKRIEENMKHKEKDEIKRIERDKTDS